LDSRIRLQKLLNLSNRLPLPEMAPQPSEDEDIRSNASTELRGLICELHNLRVDLFSQNIHAAPPSLPAKRKTFEKTNVSDIWNDIHHLDTAFKPIQNQILDKWSSKIKMAAGASSVKLKAVDTPATTQIANMVGDMERLVKRTQLRRSEYSIVGETVSGTDQYNPEIFDGLAFD
jgi:protein AATF/BFR2